MALKNYVNKFLLAFSVLATLAISVFGSEWIKNVFLYIVGTIPPILKWIAILLGIYFLLLYFFQGKLIYISYSMSAYNCA